ncbi:phosphatase RsbU N-terminal domain-containing protein [Pedococcus soli]
MTRLEDLLRDYRAAFLRYLPQRSEAALALGYQLGRNAIDDRVSLLNLVGVHHRVLAEVLAGAPEQDIPSITAAASDFLVEVLSTFDMAHRSVHDRPTAFPRDE